MYFVLFYYFYVMCLAVENWLFLTKNGFLLAIFSLLYIVSNCSFFFFFFFYLVSYICLYLFVCVCAVYELLAIKYNYTLNPLDFFSCFKPHSFYHHAHSRRGKEKSLIIKLIDFSAFFFFCALYLVTRDNFMRGVFCWLLPFISRFHFI